MSQVIIRNLDASVISAIKASAALNGRSMEAELRALLEKTFAEKKFARDRQALMERLRKHRLKLGKVGGKSTTQILREIRDNE